MSIWFERDFYHFPAAGAAAPESTTLLHMQEEMIRAPQLLTRHRQPTSRVRLDKTHPYTKHLVGCWPMWHNNAAIVQDLCGNNHATPNGAGLADIQRYTNKYGRGLSIYNASASSARLFLGSINSANPLSCSATNEISIFMWGTIANNPNNDFPRVIDKSNGGSASNGWALAIRWAGATAPNNTMDFYVNAVDWTPGDNAMGAAASDYTGTTYGFGVVAASGSQEYIWKNQILGSSSGSFTIPTTTTNATLLNWNHTTDRQWGDQPVFYIAVWDHRLDAQTLIDLSFDPYQIFIPA